jgi:hypothetical protein
MGMAEKKDKHRLLLRLWRIAMTGNHPLPLAKRDQRGIRRRENFN